MLEPSNTPAAPAAGTAEPLTIRGAVNQLVGERNQAPDTPQAPAAPPPDDDAPDPADLAALDASDEQPDATPEPEQPKVRLRDGTEVTLDELEDWRKGTLRQADYTKKTQELAEQRRQFEAQFGQFQHQTQAQRQAVEQAIALVQHFMPAPPSDDLRKQDFFAWQEQKAEYDAQVGKLQTLVQHRHRMMQGEWQKQVAEQNKYIEQQRQLLVAAMPEMASEEKVKKFWDGATKYAEKLGIPLNEFGQVSRYWHAQVIDDAMYGRRMKEHKAKIAEKAKNAEPMAPPVQNPGRRQSAAERESVALSPLKQRFEQSGSIRDAARLLSAERSRAAR